jgi:hypothetical protein
MPVSPQQWHAINELESTAHGIRAGTQRRKKQDGRTATLEAGRQPMVGNTDAPALQAQNIR